MSWAEDNGIDIYDPEWDDYGDDDILSYWSDVVWTTKHNEDLKFYEMNDQHLIRTIRYLLKRGKVPPEGMILELTKRFEYLKGEKR